MKITQDVEEDNNNDYKIPPNIIVPYGNLYSWLYDTYIPDIYFRGVGIPLLHVSHRWSVLVSHPRTITGGNYVYHDMSTVLYNQHKKFIIPSLVEATSEIQQPHHQQTPVVSNMKFFNDIDFDSLHIEVSQWGHVISRISTKECKNIFLWSIYDFITEFVNEPPQWLFNIYCDKLGNPQMVSMNHCLADFENGKYQALCDTLTIHPIVSVHYIITEMQRHLLQTLHTDQQPWQWDDCLLTSPPTSKL